MDGSRFLAFPEQRVEIQTCGNLYEEWREKKIFRSVPSGDLQFTVRYVDTSKDHDNRSVINEESPTVLALHGAPGSHADFTRLMSFMHEHGIRLIAPTFPDFSQYPPGVFRHSTSERVQYLKDFLQAIGVSRIDLLICHSSAIYSGLQLCIENINPKISGLAMFNPGAFTTKMRALKPWIIGRSCVKLCENSLGLKLYKIIGFFLLKLLNIAVAFDDPMEPLLPATVVEYGNIQKSEKLYHHLSLRKFPIFFAFSENDRLIQKQFSYDIAHALGLQDSHVFHYNGDGVLDKEGRVVNNIKAMEFEKGSHYVFSKCSEIINKEVLSFLNNNVL